MHRFNLAGNEMVYHTRFRPHLTKFLRRMVKRFQMHICTFGNRAYAHQLASILDPKRKYFCQRILSRDECFNPVTKSANLKSVLTFTSIIFSFNIFNEPILRSLLFRHLESLFFRSQYFCSFLFKVSDLTMSAWN